MTNKLRSIKGLHVSDVRGLADIAVRTTQDVTAVVEGVHRSVHATLGLPGPANPGRTGGITGLVYRSIDGVTRLTGAGVGGSLSFIEPLARRLGHAPESSREREVLLGVLNGVLGDRLEATANPLAIPMSFQHCDGRVSVDAPPSHNVSGSVLVMVHGLCMTDHGWRPGNRSERAGLDLGETLAAQAGHTPVYLRYNSGRAVADNGEELAMQLEALLANWPVPVEQLTLLGHSMGGLVARSAVAEGAHRGHAWPAHLKHMIFLGTPHHGAPLERAGALADALLAATPWARPFTRLSEGRSRGIRDLRHGTLNPARDRARQEDEEKEARAGSREPPGSPSAQALPGGVRALAVAGTRSSRSRLEAAGANIATLAGDGLVPVASALGRHPEAEQDLGLTGPSCVVHPGTGHMDLLHSRAVARSVLSWLSDH